MFGVPRKDSHYERLRDLHIRMEIIHILGNKCIHCGFSDWRALQIDHVKGHGAEHRRKYNSHTFYHGGGCNPQYYSFILRQIKLGSKDFQLLCANCNWIKRYENNECKKKVKKRI